MLVKDPAALDGKVRKDAILAARATACIGDAYVGLLRSDVAVQANIYIMRAFVHMRTSIASIDRLSVDMEHLKSRITELNNYLEDVLRDQNDINEETMIQLQLINESLAEMRSVNHAPKPEPKKIGFK